MGRPFEHPNSLVLGGGGVLGEAWMLGVLAGIEHASAFDARECERYVGTSAGSIVAARLVAGRSPGEEIDGRVEQAVPDEATVGARTLLGQAVRIGASAAGVAAAPLAVAGLRLSTAGGALARRAALSRVPPGRRTLTDLARWIERIGARFDGRLLISAVDTASGRRVMFGAPGAPQASVAEAVEASCAIPGVFRPVAIADRSYVDGGVWSPTNMDVLDVRDGERVLCLNPTGSVGRGRMGSPAAAVGALSRSVAAVEATVLRRRGARVLMVAPNAGAVEAIGPNLMDSGPRRQVLRAGFAQGAALAA